MEYSAEVLFSDTVAAYEFRSILSEKKQIMKNGQASKSENIFQEEI